MRKSLNHLKHRKSNVFALRRKALKENDTTLQNASDFWRKTEEKEAREENEAENEDDESMVVNKKGSFDVEYEKGIENANVSGIAESVIEPEIKVDKFIYQNGKIDPKKRKYIDFDTMIVKEKDDTVNDTVNETVNETISGQVNSNIDFDMGEEDNGNETIEDEKNSDEDEIDASISEDAIESDEIQSENNTSDENEEKENAENVMPKKVNKHTNFEPTAPHNPCEPDASLDKSSQINLSMSTVNNDIVRYKDNLYYVNDISKLKQRNGISFLINNDDLETGVMHLKNAAYTTNTKANRSFCILLLKGGIDVIVNDITISLKKNGMCVVNKNDYWSVKNHEKLVSRLFICYSLK